MPYIVNVIFNIFTSGLPCALLAMGIFITYRLLDFADLTAEGSFLIGGAISIALIKIGVDPFSATLVAILGGAICGFITGILHTKLKIPKLLSGIITLTLTASIGLIVLGIAKDGAIFTNLVTINKEPTIYSIFYGLLGEHKEFQPIIKTVVMAIVVIIMWLVIYYFFGTEYGMAIRATGMNEKMARAQGINTKRATLIAVMISNSLIALAGALFAQDQKSCDIKSATGFLVIGLASILIGEAIFGKRSFKNWLISISLGALVYWIVITGAIELGLNTELKNMLYAIMITIALCIPLIKEGITKFKKWREKSHART